MPSGGAPPRLIMSIGLAALIVAMVVWVSIDVRRRGRVEPLVVDPVAAQLHPRPFGISGEEHRTDLTAYTAAARIYHDGGSSAEAYAAKSPRGWRYQYPPLFAALMMPLSVCETTTQSLVWGLFGVACVVGVLFEVRTWLRILANPPDAPAGALPAWLPLVAAIATTLPALNTIQRGQVGLIVLLPLMTGFRLLWCGRSWGSAMAGGVLLAFAATLKFIPVLPVAVAAGMLVVRAVAARSGRGAPGGAAAGLCGIAIGFLLWVVAVPALLIGWQRNNEGLGIFVTQVVGNDSFAKEWEFDIHSMRNQSLSNALYRLAHYGDAETPATPNAGATIDGSSAPAAPSGGAAGAAAPASAAAPAARGTLEWVTLLLRVALGAAVVVSAARLAGRGGVRGAFAGFGLACMATLVLSPVSWGHHFVMLLPAIIGVGAALGSCGRGGGALLFSGALALACLLHYSLLPWTGPLGLLGIVTAIAFAAALVATIARPDAPTAQAPAP